ncbi:MAG: DUF6261 family protein [Prevotellaceae bacterium]|jgi:uncharacterized protein YukE|nr:DUF6261 family protein [Prevotellaceae bacterium]
MKKFITSITLRNIRNNMHFAFMRSILELLQTKAANLTHITKSLAAFEAIVADEDAALDIVRRYELTEQIHDEDRRRDTAFYGMREIIRSCLRHFDADKRDAAIRLDTLFEDYKKAPKKPLPEESADLHNLVQRLEALSADIALLGIGDWLNEMKQANDNVVAFTASRESEAAARAQFKMTNIRSEADAAYAEITARLEAAATLEGADAYSSLFGEINARISEYNTILQREKGLRHNNKNSENVDA